MQRVLAAEALEQRRLARAQLLDPLAQPREVSASGPVRPCGFPPAPRPPPPTPPPRPHRPPPPPPPHPPEPATPQPQAPPHPPPPPRPYTPRRPPAPPPPRAPPPPPPNSPPSPPPIAPSRPPGQPAHPRPHHPPAWPQPIHPPSIPPQDHPPPPRWRTASAPVASGDVHRTDRRLDRSRPCAVRCVQGARTGPPRVRLAGLSMTVWGRFASLVRADPRAGVEVAVQSLIRAGRPVGEHGRLARGAQPGYRREHRARSRAAIARVGAVGQQAGGRRAHRFGAGGAVPAPQPGGRARAAGADRVRGRRPSTASAPPDPAAPASRGAPPRR